MRLLVELAVARRVALALGADPMGITKEVVVEAAVRKPEAAQAEQDIAGVAPVLRRQARSAVAGEEVLGVVAELVVRGAAVSSVVAEEREEEMAVAPSILVAVVVEAAVPRMYLQRLHSVRQTPYRELILPMDISQSLNIMMRRLLSRSINTIWMA